MTCVSISKDVWFNFIQSILLKETFLIYPTFVYAEHCYSKCTQWNTNSESVKWKKKIPMSLYILEMGS